MAFLPKTTLVIAILFSSILTLSCVVKSTPNMTPYLIQCNGHTYDTTTDPFQQSVEYVLNYLLTITSNTPGYDLRVASPYANGATAYGHGTCQTSLTFADCGTCISAAYNTIRNNCGGHIGAKAFLIDCTIRYENYPFINL